MRLLSFHIQTAFWLAFFALRPLWNFADAGLEETDELFGRPFAAYYDKDNTLDRAIDRGFTRLAGAFVWAATGQWQLSSRSNLEKQSISIRKSWLKELSREQSEQSAVMLASQGLMLRTGN